MAQARWRVAPKGIKTVKQGGWYVRAGAPTPPAPARLPDDLIGVAGVGRYRQRPHVNPADFIVEPSGGSFFTAPRTELTGLDPQQIADFKSFDAQTAGQQQRITGAYENLAQQAQSQGAATQAALTALAGARGAGYQASDPTGQVLGQAARDQAVASTAPIVAQIGNQPTIARSEGQTQLDAFNAQRLGDRATNLANYRKQNADVAAAAAEQQFKVQQLKATLAIAQGSQATTQRGQTLTAQTAAGNRAAKLQTDIAKLQTQLKIAQDNNQTKRALALQKKIATKQKAKAAASGSDLRQWTQTARDLAQGVPTGDKDANGNLVRDFYSPSEIYAQLRAAGAPASRARRIVQSVTGQSPTSLIDDPRSVLGF